MLLASLRRSNMSRRGVQVKLDPEQAAAEERLSARRDFSPKGVNSVIEFHKTYRFDHDLQQRFPTRYSAASTAWIAGGMASDGKQDWPTNGFHSDFLETQRSTSTSEERKGVRHRLLWHTADMVSELLNDCQCSKNIK